MKPVLILLGHCGIRPAELMRLSWNEVKLKLKTVIIGSHQAKTASRRTIPITKATAQLLELFHKANQLIWKKNHGQWNKALNRLHRQAGVQQIPNGLRHSYISYRLVITADINRTALEAGNSPAMIYRHYQALIDDPQLAQDWFAIKLNANALKEFCREDQKRLFNFFERNN
jgi:integrase